MTQSASTRSLRMGVVVVTTLTLSNCGTREFLESGRHNGTLFLGTFACFAIMGFLIAFYRRRSQLGGWDLGVAPAAPQALDALPLLYWIAGIVFVLFLVADLTLVEHAWQSLLNLLLWLGGTLIGAFFGAFLGLRLAERRWR